jgi:hypothetical protein
LLSVHDILLPGKINSFHVPAGDGGKSPGFIDFALTAAPRWHKVVD